MPCPAKNPLLKKSATQNERNFRVDFYAEDAIRLSPYKDDKWKYAENTPFWADSDYFRLPKQPNYKNSDHQRIRDKYYYKGGKLLL